MGLVVLVGVSGSGKSTFARTRFKPTEVVSSDFCRGLVADDENDQSATAAAFEVLQFIAGQRLKAGRLTVIDATNVQPEARRELVMLAREHDVLPAAIVLDLPEKLCAERNAGRPDRDFGPHVLRRQRGQLRRGLRGLGREGFRTVHVLHTPEEVAAAAITRTRLYSDLRHEAGPFDIIGDVHGCRAELEELLAALCYEIDRDAAAAPYSPATWSTGARTRRACCAWSWAWLRPGPRSAWPATTRPNCSRRCAARTSSAATAWTPRWSSWTPRPRSSGPAWRSSSTA
jgi:protein phosphatase